MKIGFDNNKYLQMQSERILERIHHFGGKLYLEFGGKLFDDYHASRVLPGFAPDAKLQMLLQLKDQAELVIAINAEDIESGKVRGDYGITYDADVIRLIKAYRDVGLYVGSVCLTRYTPQPLTDNFRKRLEEMGVPSFCHYRIAGYPSDVETVVSDEGYGRNEYIVTSRPLVVVTAPGPGSGKMATCLSQLYHENKRGVKAGYAKFETFPIWNVPLKHPINLAYEAATADLADVNMIDPFHLEAYGETTVNYNRDIEIFPVVNAMFQLIFGESPYKSPTDMGVNMAGYCICDDEACRAASRQEILRRYMKAQCDHKRGATGDDLTTLKILVQQAGITTEERPVIGAAQAREAATDLPAAAIELPDGTLITGKTSDLLGCTSAALLSALKALAGIDADTQLVAPEAIAPIQMLKTEYLGSRNPRLHCDEVMIALSASAATDPIAARAMAAIPLLRGCEAHATVLLSRPDESIYRRLGINLTCDAKYEKQ